MRYFGSSQFPWQRTIHESTRSVTKHEPFFVRFSATSWIELFVLSKECALSWNHYQRVKLTAGFLLCVFVSLWLIFRLQ